MWRLYLVFMFVGALFALLSWKVLDLQVFNNEVLQTQGDKRTVRNDVIAAHRGNIMDREGQPLAISTPVKSLWVNPKELVQQKHRWPELESALSSFGINFQVYENRIIADPEDEHLYIKRRLPPSDVEEILKLDIPGVYEQEEYKRYYPLGEVAVHFVGITNSDDIGQEGLELAYEDWLKGSPGSKQVLKDERGGIIREVKVNEVAQPGRNLELSMDSRIQFLAYKALKEEVVRRQAKSGSAVVLDVDSGEVLAMVNQPSYNPNNRENINPDGLRNRALMDLIEPGSTVKTFTITAALESGLFDEESTVDTSPGYIRVDRTTIRDPKNYEIVDLEKIITKSSQVGAVKIGLTLGEGPMLAVWSRVGVGEAIGSGFPGESTGVLPNRSRWSKADIASLAYGYGFHVTPLQLAQAYLVYANGGIRKPVSLLKVNEEVSGQRVLDKNLVAKVSAMLETVVQPDHGGTGTRADIPAYKVAGKTGTAWHYDNEEQAYDDENYNSYFAGFAPASDPKIVVVVTIQEPKGEEYGGGQVAAPVFAKIASGALRVLNAVPDKNVLEVTDSSLSQAGTNSMSIWRD